MKRILGMFAAVLLLFGGAAQVRADLYLGVNWPTIGADSHPSIIAVFEPNGSTMIVTTGQGPYDGIEDAYIGFINNSSSPVSSVTVTSTNGAFGFDGDGIDTYTGIFNIHDSTGYGGPLGFFTNVTGTQATLNFDSLAPGASTYSSFEGSPSSLTGLGIVVTAVPEPASLAVFSVSLAGLVVYGWRRRKVVV